MASASSMPPARRSVAAVFRVLLELGLLRRSFVPSAAQRELRDVVRYRKRLIENRTQEANRLQKVLETANIKLGGVATEILGVSARAMIKALIAGDQLPAQVAELAQRSLRRKRAALAEALTGRVTAHHRFLLDHLLRDIEFLDDAIATCDREIATRTAKQADALARLDTIPGVAQRTAEVIGRAGRGYDALPRPRAMRRPGLGSALVPTRARGGAGPAAPARPTGRCAQRSSRVPAPPSAPATAISRRSPGASSSGAATRRRSSPSRTASS